MEQTGTPHHAVRGRYLSFARLEAAGSSRVYERLALAVQADDAAVALVSTLPVGKTQPNLLFGALRWHGVPVDAPGAALAWLLDHEDAVPPTDADTASEDTPNREAQRQRQRRREAEEARDAAMADRDALALRLSTAQSREAERLAGEVLADGTDLFTLGSVALDDLIGEDGHISADAVHAAAQAIVEARGQRIARPARNGAAFDAGADRGAAPRHRVTGWNSVFSADYRDRVTRGQR